MARVNASTASTRASRNSAGMGPAGRKLRQLPAYIGDDAITLFLTDTPARLARLRIASQQADLAEIREISHCLKGVAGFIAADRLAELCERLELLTDSGGGEVGEIISALEAEAARVCAELKGQLRIRHIRRHR